MAQPCAYAVRAYGRMASFNEPSYSEAMSEPYISGMGEFPEILHRMRHVMAGTAMPPQFTANFIRTLVEELWVAHNVIKDLEKRVTELEDRTPDWQIRTTSPLL